MPLIVMCGYPSSGKTKRAEELKQYFEQKRGKTVHLVGDHTIGVERNKTYSVSLNEKSVRGTLKSLVQRLISRDDILIFDSLNYIKGYRYELFCVVKEHKTPHCIVHCDTPKETCQIWNSKREDDGYSEDILDALVMRFECPDSRNRWDSPLFTIQVDDELPLDSIYEAVVNRVPPRPNLATQSQPLAATNFLYELDRITQDIVTEVFVPCGCLLYFKFSVRARKTELPVFSVLDLYMPWLVHRKPSYLEIKPQFLVQKIDPLHVELCRQVTMAELRRLRRQFITYTKTHPVEDTTKIANMFVQYLNNSIK